MKPGGFSPRVVETAGYMPKVTFIVDGEERVLEVDLASQLTPAEVALIHAALADLKQSMSATDRNVIQVKTAALNQATQHLAEVMMNWTVQAALAGRTADEVAAQGR